MTVSAEARELAGKTAAEIRRRGWIQGDMADYETHDDADDEQWRKDCRVCLVGGIAAAVTGDPTRGEDYAWGDPGDPAPVAVRELAHEIALRTAGLDFGDASVVNGVIHWNDTRDSVDEVLAVLDSIATGQ